MTGTHSYRTGRLARAWAVPLREKQRAVQASAWLFVVAIGLRIAGFTRTRQLLEWLVPTPRRDTVALGACPHIFAVTEERTAVGRAAVVFPFATCLVRALTLWILLRRRGVETVLKVGVYRHREGLMAHAWLEAGDRPIAEAAEIAGHTVFREPLIARTRRERHDHAE